MGVCWVVFKGRVSGLIVINIFVSSAFVSHENISVWRNRVGDVRTRIGDDQLVTVSAFRVVVSFCHVSRCAVISG